MEPKLTKVADREQDLDPEADRVAAAEEVTTVDREAGVVLDDAGTLGQGVEAMAEVVARDIVGAEVTVLATEMDIPAALRLCLDDVAMLGIATDQKSAAAWASLA